MAAVNSNQLTDVHKEFIVKRLAAFYTPSVICQQLVAQFGLKCNENDILANDPTTSVVSPELFILFRTEREKILTDPSSDPYTDQKARLVLLGHMVDCYKNNNRLPDARAVLKQIAEELGVVGGKGAAGKAAVAAAVPASDPVEEIRVTIVDPKA